MRRHGGSDFLLIDLESMIEGHTCTYRAPYDFLTAKGDSLARGDFSHMCDLLEDATFNMEFWRGSKLSSTIHIQYLPS